MNPWKDRHTLAERTAICLVWLGAIMLAPSVHAQVAPPRSTEVRGSETPELIPDRDAYWMMFLHLSDGAGAFKWTDRVHFLRSSGLTLSQIDTLLRLANEYRAANDSARSRGRAIKAANPERPMSPATISALNAVAVEDANALDAAIQHLVSALDGEGRWKLKNFLDKKVKATMTLTKAK